MTSKPKENLFYTKDYSIFKAILEQSGEGFSLVDQRGNYVGVNKAFCEMTGYSEAELLSMEIAQLVPRETRLELFPDVVNELSSERRIEMIKKNGELFQVNVKACPIHHDGLTYYLGFVRDITPQYMAEGNFKISEEKYRTLFDSAPDPIVIHDGKAILDLNPAALAALSLTDKKQMIGQDPFSQVHPDDLEKAMQRLNQLIEGRHPLKPEEFRLVLHNNEERVVLASPVPVKFDDKQAFMVNYHDITERKITSEELLKAKEFAENLMETANTMVVAFDADALITNFNKFAEELTGYDKTEVIGKNWFQLFLPERDRARFPLLFSEVLKQMPEASHNENYICTKSGEERLISWSNNVMLSQTGEARGVLSIGLDITERKLAEEALRMSEEHYRNVVQDQTEYIMRYLPDGSITFVNDSYCRAFNINPEQAIGQNIIRKNLDTEVERIARKIEALSTENPIFVDEHVSVTPGGENVWHLWIDRGIFDENGVLKEIQAVGRDITERKLMEESLHASTGKLEEALVEAHTANRVKDQFIANISHEIRTPLNSILGFSDIFNQRYNEFLGKNDEKIFDYINSASTRLMRTVDSMLNISQIEAGSIKIFPRTIDLVSIATSVVEESRQTAEEKGLDILLRTDLEKAEVYADEYCIHQAVMNLVENASKFTFEGSIGIEIVDYGNQILLSVIDSGIGISEEYINRIYEPYTQESEGFTKNFQGIGLGMALTKHYVDLNNVDIKIKSEAGSGTTFTLIFPQGRENNYVE